MKRLEIKIPLIHIISITIFFIVVNLIISKETQGKNELSELLYSISFFMTNDFVAIILGILLFAPLPLLIFSFFKKRKDLIKGFSISTLISLVLIMMANFS